MTARRRRSTDAVGNAGFARAAGPKRVTRRGRTSSPRVVTDRAAFRRALLAWYDAQARPLPWRRGRDPYRVWIAEVMLQQTRIAVVIPAYRRFLRAFPSVARLARASEEEVLSAWSGLGYYSRARALHRAARILAQRGSSFPRDVGAARELPGVGVYTAAAVLSIAHDRPVAAVDGNVNRVLARLACLPVPDAKGEPHFSLAGDLLAPRRPGDWNQAMMELGETVCLPRAPLCDCCPVRRFCRAHDRGEVALYPRRRARRAAERVDLRMTLVSDGRGRLLLERGAFPYLRHLWLPPLRPRGAGDASPRRGAERRGSFRHAIVHRQFDVEVFHRIVRAADPGRALGPAAPPAAERRFFAPGEIGRIGRSALLTKALRLLPPKPAP